MLNETHGCSYVEHPSTAWLAEANVTPVSIDALDTKDKQQLIHRVLASRHFTKAPLLSAFLSYVCTRALHDGVSRISEQEIGVSVFGREQGYDSREDNIVRNYARQLRRRLDDYFSTDGRDETLRLEIPKGGYIPLFTLRRGEFLEPEIEQRPSPNDEVLPLREGISSGQFQSQSLRVAALAVCLALLSLSGVAFYRTQHSKGSSATMSRMTPLWKQLFVPNKDTFLVPADTGFVTLQDMQKRTISLTEYESWSSVEQPGPSFVSNLKTRKYTSVVDLDMVSRLEHLPETVPEHCLIRTARSLTIEDIKDGNLILLGSIYSIPWIEMIQKDLNFRFIYRPSETHFAWIENLDPSPGEAATYASSWNGPFEKTYAVIAFIPNLNKIGHILLVQGLGGAGTEAADNLILREGGLDEVLDKARRPDGTIGSFEALLESTSVDSHATSIRIVAIRTPHL
jgi:hypothetical protein